MTADLERVVQQIDGSISDLVSQFVLMEQAQQRRTEALIDAVREQTIALTEAANAIALAVRAR